MNSELRDEIVAALRKFRSSTKAANSLGIDIRVVLPIADELANEPRGTRVAKFNGDGPPHLRPYLVAKKKAWEAWENRLPEISDARAKFEAGTHDLATGRDGQWLYLYCFPQVKVTPRPGYFKRSV